MEKEKMINFFKPEDFHNFTHPEDRISICSIANAKLEREGVLVDGKKYGFVSRVLIVNMERIECTHPKEKVELRGHRADNQWFRCECGTKVRPKEFEEIK